MRMQQDEIFRTLAFRMVREYQEKFDNGKKCQPGCKPACLSSSGPDYHQRAQNLQAAIERVAFGGYINRSHLTVPRGESPSRRPGIEPVIHGAGIQGQTRGTPCLDRIPVSEAHTGESSASRSRSRGRSGSARSARGTSYAQY